ncbi:MAG: FecR family protein [Chitinophagaceae bacterium]
MRELFIKYIDNQCTVSEVQVLAEYFGNPSFESELRSLILQELEKENETLTTGELEYLKEGYIQLRERIVSSGSAPVVPISRRFLSRVAAAAVLILAVAGTYFIFNRSEHGKKIVSTENQNDVAAPDRSRAAITLADGTRVYLDSAGQGEIASQMNVKLIRSSSGELIYESAEIGVPVEVSYNTLFNPRGSRPISLTLSDGTHVWLNSESSLRYPIAFTGSERHVEISGEAYFEVAKDAARKFQVEIPGKGNVEVLGTHFNINAFGDDGRIYTTLLEGRVKINSNLSASVVLSPGEQAIMTKEGGFGINPSPDIEEVMAWKNGRFIFGESLDLATVMKQIARWYDLEVEFMEPIQTHIGGSIQRNVPVSKVLQMLEETGVVHFQLSGRKVTVSAKK